MQSLKPFRQPCLALILLSSCGGGDDGNNPPIQYVPSQVRIDAGTSTGLLRPMWGDHYDLSYTHFDYPSEPGFTQVMADLQVRSFRCSIGRWEVGFPPAAGGDSMDPGVLALVEREFYRGPNTLIGADDPGNYAFGYVDDLLQNLTAAGADPYLCFDYMPFTLAAEQDPSNAFNANVSMPGTPYATLSFSNGIRTSPPADPLVYARVIRNVMRHTRGLFAGTTDFGLTYFEVGNEPDAIDLTGSAFPYFWTGDATQFFAMYDAIADEVDADPQLSSSVQLGAGSFAVLPGIPGAPFLDEFLGSVATNTTRLDYLSFHTYGDEFADHLAIFLQVQGLTANHGLNVPWVNGEWGRDLGGTDPVYDQIEHGLLRAKVLALMQVFPFTIAHESLFRDPGTSGGELGLIRTGPPAHKPASQVYRALATFNDSLNALHVVDNPDQWVVLSARNNASTKVLAAIVVDEPAAGTAHRLQFLIENLPWGAGDYSLVLRRVTQGTSDSGAGIETVSTETRSGGMTDFTWDVHGSEQGLYWLELNEL
ncbi:MAG: hypothetical protein R3F33_04100 [Planctomycetota bacterium]